VGALDTPLLVAHLEALRRGEAVEVPIYDFVRHRRSGQTVLARPERLFFL
jgi:uridine kinase